MITVSILINSRPIFTRSAVKIKSGVYKLDTGMKILHDYEDGAVKLAIKMLKTIKEVK